MPGLLTELVRDAAARNPGHAAFVFEDRELDYATLEARSNALAHTLAANGVQHRDRVGICMDKSLEMAIALYGIMKAGAAYVPMDVGAPLQRLESIVRDCGIRHLVTADNKHRIFQHLVDRTGLRTLVGVDTDAARVRCIPWREVAESATGVLPLKILEQDLAYVIYTSGSTGTPKGIMHTHHSGLSFARWAAREYGLRPNDRIGNHAPLHFDISVFDMFATACVGGTTILISEAHLKLPPSYSELLSRQRVTVLFTVPFALIQLLLRGVLQERNLDALRWVIFGGEPFPPKHLRELMQKLPSATFDNMYGPAEVNGCTHYTLVNTPLGDSIPIGYVADIADALIVDSTDQQVVPGEPGELLIRTPTMMAGYWNREDLNAGAFLRRTVAPGREDDYYRTGDLVRETGDGMLHFLGRMDRQVKVRGYRVELDEIELALALHEQIEEAAAFTTSGPDDSLAVHAAVTVRGGVGADTAALLKHARTHLPWYAVPTVLQIRESFPRTSSGKIDRLSLAEEAACPNEHHGAHAV